MDGNDFLQVHRYLDCGGELDVCRGPMDVLAADAVRELRDRNPRKPVLLAEVGAVKPNHTGPSILYAQDREGTLLHDALFAPFFAGSAGSGCSADSAGCSVSGSGFCSGVNVPFSSPISQSSTEAEGFGA